VLADWNDVHASALVAVAQHETTILTTDDTETSITFHLKTIRDETGTLVVTRDAQAGDDRVPIPLHLSCSIGLFGNDSLERAILDSMRRRLEKLAGVDFSPIK
jgi:hypothetical protein